MDYSLRAISYDKYMCYDRLNSESKILLGLLFLIQCFGLVKVEGLSGSSRNLGYRAGHSVKADKERYREYRRNKTETIASYITISIFTKLQLDNVLTDPRMLWTSGIVPFTISKNCSKKQKKIILEVMKRFKLDTCVRFIPRKNETTFITISPGKRCRTAVDNLKDTEQTADEGCYAQDNVLNELMYVLDFTHEQNKLGDKNNFLISRKGVRVNPRSDTSKINTVKINYMYGCKRKELIGSRDRINEHLDLSHAMSRSFRKKRYTPQQKTEYTEIIRPRSQLYTVATTPFVQETTEIQSTTNNRSTGVTDIKGVSDNSDSSFTSTGDSDSSDNSDSSTGDSDSSDSSDSSTGDSDSSPITKSNTTVSRRKGTRITVGNVTTTDQTNERIEVSTVSSQSEEFHRIEILGDIDSRAALSYPTKLWEDGVIPFVLSDKYDAVEKNLILKGMAEFHSKTCAKFIQRKDQKTYISIQPGMRCSATIGKIDGGVNNVTLGQACFAPGTIVHELMHVMGFIHEQNRPDRDSYVIIVWDNIIPHTKSNFKKKEEGEVITFGIGYDYESVMHYGQYDFAVDQKRPTIIPLQSGVKIGQRDGFSKKDIQKINKLFNCQTKGEFIRDLKAENWRMQ